MIRTLLPADAASFREIRLEALRDCPAAFGASYETEREWPIEAFARRIPGGPPDAVFGAWEDGDVAMLAGIAGFRVCSGLKERHKGMVWGMFVRPVARGSGMGRALLGAVIEHAATVAGVEIVQLSVVTAQAAARALYDRMGFVPYGIERRALRVGAEYYDEELRALVLATGGDGRARPWMGGTGALMAGTSRTSPAMTGWMGNRAGWSFGRPASSWGHEPAHRHRRLPARDPFLRPAANGLG